jgi:RNA polymerase sigma-70 factor (ECF subfamily)
MAEMDGGSGSHRRGLFATTQWSLVVAAGDSHDPDARDAMAQLCRTYWHPIYVYVRRRGADSERALDLTQGFFARLLEKEYVKDVRRERGRFRTFLLTALKGYLANEWDRETALKRGGGQPLLSLDGLEAEQIYKLEPVDDLTPEKLFDRRWTRSLLAQSLGRLGAEMSCRDRSRAFERLSPFLTGEESTGYREVAVEFGMSESAVKVTVHRMRQRFRAILREDVARTIVDPSKVDDELQHLLMVMSG